MKPRPYQVSELTILDDSGIRVGRVIGYSDGEFCAERANGALIEFFQGDHARENAMEAVLTAMCRPEVERTSLSVEEVKRQLQACGYEI